MNPIVSGHCAQDMLLCPFVGSRHMVVNNASVISCRGSDITCLGRISGQC